MIRAVIDTNVLIRYLIRPGAATRALVESFWVSGRFEMVTAPALIAELEDVLARPRIRALVQPEEAAVLMAAIRSLARLIAVDLDAVPAYTRDPKDDRFVACAIAGNAHFLVTEDQDILLLDSLSDVRMVTPYAFVELLRELPPEIGEIEAP